MARTFAIALAARAVVVAVAWNNFPPADDGVIYFKADDSNRPDFLAAGMGPFLPFGDPDRPMQYYELPAEVLEDPEQLAPWMAKAIAVAAKAKPKATRKPKAAAKPKATRK